eukprot:5291523-Lingulodinium_polyedra.AAC.1
MKVRQPTWARERAEEEAFYVHPLTRASLDLAMRPYGDMPVLEGVPGDVVLAQPAQEQPAYGAGIWQGRLGAGDRLLADMPVGAK